MGGRWAFPGQPLAPRAPGRPDPDDRAGDVARNARALGIAAAGGGRALRRDPDIRPGVQRPAAAGARLLLARTAFEAGRRRADRLADPFLGHAGMARAGRPGTRGAHFGGAARAGEDGRRDLRAQGQGRPRRDMSEPELLEERRGESGEIVWLTLNRPQARNALTFPMYDRIGEVCHEVNADPSVRTVVFIGAGGRAFAAGTDISQFRAFDKEENALAYEKRVMEICSTVSAHAPLTLETAKEALRRIRVQMTPRDGGSDLLIRAYMSEDFREGIDAFFAKRPARWKGR